jgi:ATP-dependent RNA helicase RhlE
MTFNELGLIEPIIKALEKEGHVIPSPIQEQSIPHILEGKDVLGCAQTGTGKTAAFALPIIQRLIQTNSERTSIKALILTPTRELAIQVRDNFRKYGAFTNLKCGVILGGVNQRSQIEVLRNGIDILVATPGRLLDLIEQKHVKLNALEILVLDEADTMLDMGFIYYVKKIISHIPIERQTLMFSATMPNSVNELAKDFLKDYVTVKVNPESPTVDRINQTLYYVDKANKTKLLMDLLNDEEIKSVLVFTRTKHGANKLAESLEKNGINNSVIHGNKTQRARIQALSDFKTGKSKILIATDIAARGIDIIELSHVINYEMPDQAEVYIHRIGRTGRAGLTGKAISFCNIDEKSNLKDIQRLIKKEIDVVDTHNYPMEQLTLSPKEPNRNNRSRNNSRSGNRKEKSFGDRPRSGNSFYGNRSNGSRGNSHGDNRKEKSFGDRPRSGNSSYRNRSNGSRGNSQGENRGERAFGNNSRNNNISSSNKPVSRNASYLQSQAPSLNQTKYKKKRNNRSFHNKHSQDNRWNNQKRGYR